MKSRVTFGKFEGDLANGRSKRVYVDGKDVGEIEAVVESNMLTSASRHTSYWIAGYVVEMDDEAHLLSARNVPHDYTRRTFATLADAQQAVRDSFQSKGRVRS